jgi:hypothetical protein
MAFGYFLYWRYGMALIKCPECARQVSEAAVACPGCGYPIADGATGVQVYETAGWSAEDRKSLCELLTGINKSCLNEFNDEGDLVVTFSSDWVRDAHLSDNCFFGWLALYSNGEVGDGLPRDKWELLSEGKRKARRSEAARKHARGVVAPKGVAAAPQGVGLTNNPHEKHNNKVLRRKSGVLKLGCDRCGLMNAVDYDTVDAYINPNSRKNRGTGLLQTTVNILAVWSPSEPKVTQAVVCAQCQYPLVRHL